MSRTIAAMFAGLILGIVATWGNFGAFVVVVFFGALGLVIGLILDGKINVSNVLSRGSDRR